MMLKLELVCQSFRENSQKEQYTFLQSAGLSAQCTRQSLQCHDLKLNQFSIETILLCLLGLLDLRLKIGYVHKVVDLHFFL